MSNQMLEDLRMEKLGRSSKKGRMSPYNDVCNGGGGGVRQQCVAAVCSRNTQYVILAVTGGGMWRGCAREIHKM